VFRGVSRLAVKLSFFVLALLLAVIWGLVWYFNIALKRDLESLVSTQQFSAVSVIAASIDRQIRLRLRALEDLAQVFGERHLVYQSEQANAFLHDNLTLSPLFNGGFFVLDAQGVCIAEVPHIPGRIGLNFTQYDEFTPLLNQRAPVVGTPRIGKLSKRPLVALNAPIIDSTQQQMVGLLIGVTYLDVENYIGQLIATYEAAAGNVFIFDPSAEVFVASTDPARILKPVPSQGSNPMHDRYMAGYEGSGIAGNSAGIEKLYSGRRIPTTGWFVASALPVSSAFAPIAALQRTLLGAALILSLIVPWLAAAVVGYWLRPLRQTTSALREMTLDQRSLRPLPIVTRDEIGDLIGSFNELVRDIEDWKKVTAALAQSEERYRVLLDLSPEAIFVHRHDVLIMANRSTARLFGVERQEELLNKTWLMRVHPDSRAAVKARIEMVENADGLLVLPSMEQRFLRVDGSAVEVEVTTSGIRLTEGIAVLSIAHDITQRKADEARLKTLLAQQAALLDNALVGIVLIEHRRIMQCNRRYEELFGYDEGELLGRLTEILYVTGERYPDIAEQAYSALAQDGTYVTEVWLKRKDGSAFWGYLTGKALDIENPDGGSVWICADLTAQKHDQQRLQLAASVFESTTEGIMITDANRGIVAINPAFTETTGYTAEEVIGKDPSLLNSGRQPSEFYRHMWEGIQREDKWRGEIWNRRKNGDLYPELLSISVVRDKEQRIAHYVGVFTDISAQKHAEQQLSFLAHHDPLTRLPNRVLFDDRLSHALERAQRDHGQLAVIFIDLDRFKDVNDTLGHPVGDQLLQTVARKFQRSVRASDTLARFGGDEFALLIENIAEAWDATLIAQKLLNVFNRSILLGEHEVHVSASIGISIYPTDGLDSCELLKNADAAMYRAKANGRHNYACYSPEMTDFGIERLRFEAGLRRSIPNQELLVYFQPQVNLATGALVGAEALVRWRHPELGLIPPIKFVPLAEEIGFISALGEWVLREVCSKLKAWRAAGGDIPRIAVNLSVKQIERGDMIDLVADILAETGLVAGSLEMEITESFIAKGEQAIRFVQELRTFGVSLSVDDFGTGYSSLAYLKRLPLQTLKIDRSFVMDIGSDANNETIIRTIITLAGSLGLKVVAEGIETAEQVNFLLREGCQIGQGFYFSPPLPEAEFIARWLKLDPDRATG